MPGGFTGNGSLNWFVAAQTATRAMRLPDEKLFHYEGRDDTPEEGRLRIVISVPQTERAAFKAQLEAAAKAADSASRVEFDIPIEDVAWEARHRSLKVKRLQGDTPSSYQVYVDWDTVTASGGKLSRKGAAGKSARKRPPARPARRAARPRRRSGR